MNLICQQSALSDLEHLANHHRHGVIVTGGPKLGKTYLARQYAKLLGVSDFYIINPILSDLRSVITACTTSGTSVVLCVENLDTGVVQAAYPLLKLIEDCPNYIYVVVTCNNLAGIPDTILSRCAVVTVNSPTSSDIEQYTTTKYDISTYEELKGTHIWKCIHSLGDIDAILGLSDDQKQYIANLSNISFKDSVSNIAWKLQHYEDKTDTPIILVLRYLYETLSGRHRAACLSCLNDLLDNRMSKNAIISRFVFELKYTEY